MSVTLDTALGTGNAGSTNAASIVTTAAVAAGAHIILIAARFSPTPASTLSISATGGLTWVEDVTVVSGSLRISVFRAYAPAGLASGTTLTVMNTAGASDFIVGAGSFLGIDTSGTVITTGSGSGATAAWSTGSLASTSGNAIIGGVFTDGLVGTSAPTAPTVELYDVNVPGQNETETEVYKLSVAGADSLDGTWSGASAWVAAAVCYKAAAGAAAAPDAGQRALRIPNPRVGPMALRHSFRRQTIPASEAPAAVTTITISVFPLPSSEAWGSPTVQRIAIEQTFSSSEAWGKPTAQRIARTPAAASAEAWGTPTVQRIVRELVFASSESWGSPKVQRLARALAAATGEAWGTPTLQRILREGSLTSSETWGIPKLQRIVVELPFGSSEAWGRPLVIGGIIGNTITLMCAAIASAEAWGLPRVQRIARAQGITSAEQFGLVTAQRIGRVLAVPTSEQVGRPTLQRVLRAAQIQSSEQVGIPKVSRFLIAVNIATGETWGSPVVIGGAVVNFPSVAGEMLLSDRAAYEIVMIDGQTYAIGIADAAAFGITSTDQAAFGAGISDIRAGDVKLSDDD